MPTQPLVKKHVPDYHDESRFERIDGRYVERPGPGRKHARVQLNVAKYLETLTAPASGTALQEWSVTQPETANWDDPNYMTPDVLLAFTPFLESERGHLIPPGFLAVEVKSPDQKDNLIDKAKRYYSWGIPHIWIIDPETRECVEYHGGNILTIATDALHAGELSIPLNEVFAGLD
jgi:Uma2 family endonuclease